MELKKMITDFRTKINKITKTITSNVVYFKKLSVNQINLNGALISIDNEGFKVMVGNKNLIKSDHNGNIILIL